MHKTKLYISEWTTYKWTHSARPRIGDASLEGHPLKVGSLSVGEGTVEDGEDVRHVVHADSWAFKDGAEEMRCINWVRLDDGEGNAMLRPAQRKHVSLDQSVWGVEPLSRSSEDTYFLLSHVMWSGSAFWNHTV